MKLISVFITIFLIIILILSVYYIRQSVSIIPKAKNLNNTLVVSFSNSYVFASPVRAKINGESIRITVFVLDDRGFGIFDKKVTLGNNNEPITINNLQSLTDETGKAIFDISSTKTGIYFIEASVDGDILPQRVKIVFD